jgi:hypothetical protein
MLHLSNLYLKTQRKTKVNKSNLQNVRQFERCDSNTEFRRYTDWFKAKYTDGPASNNFTKYSISIENSFLITSVSQAAKLHTP